MSAIASAQQNHSPVLVLGGRAPAMRWGQGSLQEIDHVPFVRPLVKLAATAGATAEIPGLIDDAWAVMRRDHPGPAFLDFPLDVVFMEAEELAAAGGARRRAAGRADAAAVERAAALLRDAERPVIMAGTNLYWGHGEDALRELSEAAGIPVFLNGLARGCLPADHPNFFSRARSAALKGADVALVIGVPMDFRLGFGGSFGEETEIVAIDLAEPERDHPRAVAAECYGDIAGDAGRAGRRAGADTSDWLAHLRGVEAEKREAEREQLTDDRAPLHPMRDLRRARPGARPQRDRRSATAATSSPTPARVVSSYEPGCWLDPGPFGCLGSGPGYALAAKLAHPDRQVVLLLGDGAFGFSGMEFDTLARHGVNVVGVMGNNGIWALEKHPMEFLYGYSVAAELTPETRYDQVVEALGGHGELVREPGELRAGAGARVRGARAGAGQRADRPVGRLPALGEPGLAAVHREAARGGGGRLQVGPVRTGRGTCLKGPIWVARTAGGADDAASPGPMASWGRRREARPPFPTR